jgi:hypothetical protein
VPGPANHLPLKKPQTAEQANLEAVELIPPAVPEVRKLLWQWLWRHPPKSVHIIGWSLWRRHHQAVARTYHYRGHRLRDNLQL